MYKLKDDDMRVPAYIWSEKGTIEDGAIQQIKNASNLPFAFHHTVLCPDAHQGYGAPIGGVMASLGYVVPFFVGVDIGCGMCAVKTHLTADELTTDLLKIWMGEIRQAVPAGFDHHEEKQNFSSEPVGTITEREFEKAKYQIGTLGGGNHFIEIQKGSDGYIWVMIHSGSRNLGKQVADYYNKIAVELNEKYFSVIDKKQELAFLPIDSKEAHAYLEEMNYCVDFALANRQLMLDRISGVVGHVFDDVINIAHNYAKFEHHFGKDVLIHRKGATLASENTIGIIPGSQGTKSYIVKGKGNKDSFESCSHGAGRKMGRGQAIRELNLEDEIKRLNDQGIVHGIRHAKDLDEASGAYKDIDIVMNNQKDLVEILVELTPLGVIKG